MSAFDLRIPPSGLAAVYEAAKPSLESLRANPDNPHLLDIDRAIDGATSSDRLPFGSWQEVNGEVTWVAASAPTRAASPAPASPPVVVVSKPLTAAIEALRLPGTDVAVDAAKATPAVPPPPQNAAVLPDQVRAEWRESVDLQAEFPHVESYVAFRQAESKGLVKIFAPVVVTPVIATKTAPLPDQLRAEWRESIDLQHEFSTVEAYVAYRQAEAKGLVRIIAPGAARFSAPAGALNFVKLEETWRAEWVGSVALQREFGSADNYTSYKRAAATGRIRINGRDLSKE